MIKGKGRLIIIGGAEDKKGECIILRRFLELTGVKGARIVVVTAASQSPLETGGLYKSVFQKLGCPKVEIFDIPDRKTANCGDAIECICQATGVFFTGGDQLRITSSLGGTRLLGVLRERFEQGLVVAGTSAGASVMSSTMIAEGNSDDSANLNTLKMAAGLGFAEGVIIDQHFAQRGRIGRLLTALGQNPSLLGIGIDEDTSVIMEGNCLQVCGSKTVMVLDGKKISHTNASMLKPDQCLALAGVIIHVLPHGYKYDLKKGLVIE